MSIIKNLEEAVKVMQILEEEGYIMDFDPTYVVGCEVIKQLSGLNKEEPDSEFMKENAEVYTYNKNDKIGDDYIYFVRPEILDSSDAFC